MVIIQPKSMTGRILLTTREVKATIVVITVYRQGLTIDVTVSLTSCRWSASGLAA